MVTHRIKICLLLARKAMTNFDSVLKSRSIILLSKVCIVKAVVFPVVMYECESWTIKKAEHQRIDDFKLWCWRKLLGVPWTAKRLNQSILKEICPEYSLEGLIVKLKSNTLVTWWEELTHWKRPWCWERLEAGGEWNRGWDGWMASLTWWTRVWASSGSWWSSGKPGVLQSTVLQRIGHNWATQLNWTDLQRERETTKAELESFDKNSDSKDLNSNLSSVKWLYLSGSQFPSLMNEFTSQCCSIMAFQGWKRS